MDLARALEGLDRLGFEGLRWLLSVLWQSSLLLLAAGGLARLLRRRPAAVRHAVWAAAIVVAPLVPVLTWAASSAGSPQAPLPLMPPYEAVARADADMVSAPFAPLPPDGVPEAAALPEPQAPGLWDFPWAIGFALYAAGAAGMLALVAFGRLRLWSWRRRGTDLRDVGALAAFAAARDRLGLERTVRVVESPSVPGPLTLGTLRPTVLLPEGMAGALSAEELNSVAVHELAHVARNDALTLAAVSLVRAVVFFHPLVWLGARQVAHLAEDAADDAVLEAGTEPVSYAKLLARLASELPRRAVVTEMAAGFALRRSAFFRRVEGILSNRRDRIRKLTRLTLVGTLLAALVSLGVALALPLGDKDGGGDTARWQQSVVEGDPRNREKAAEHLLELCRGGRIGAGEAERIAETLRPILQGVGDSLRAQDGQQPPAWAPELNLVWCLIRNGLVAKSTSIELAHNLDAAWCRYVPRAPARIKLHGTMVVVPVGVVLHRVVWVRAIDGKATNERVFEFFISSIRPGGIKWGREAQCDFTPGPTKSLSLEVETALYQLPPDSMDALPVGTSTPEENALVKGILESRGAQKLAAYTEFAELTEGLGWRSALFLRAEEAREAVATRKEFVATLPNDAIVELVGVSRHPSEGQPWWRPDGSPMSKPVGYRFSGTVAGPEAREFAIRLREVPKGGFQVRARSPQARGAVQGSVSGDGTASGYLGASFPENVTSCSIEVGVAAGSWETRASTDGRDRVSVGLTGGGLVFGRAQTNGDGIVMSVSHDMKDLDVRIVAVDDAGGLRTPDRTPTSAAGGVIPPEAFFRGLALEQVQEFRVQTRPVQWIEFRNVSLEPGHRTDVEAVLEGEGRAAAKGEPSKPDPEALMGQYHEEIKAAAEAYAREHAGEEPRTPDDILSYMPDKELAGKLRPALESGRVEARKAVLKQRLHGLGLALMMHRQRPGGYPKELKELEELGYLDEKCLLESFNVGEQKVQYVVPKSDDPNEVLLYHWPPYAGGTPVLYQNMDVDWVLPGADGSLVNPRTGDVIRPPETRPAEAARAPAVGAAGQAGGSLREVMDKVRAREARITSLRCSWKTQKVVPKDSIRMPDFERAGILVPMGRPLEDMTFEETATLVIDGQRAFCEWRPWIWSVKVKEFTRGDSVAALVGGQARMLNRKNGSAYVGPSKSPFDSPDFSPPMFAYRLFDSALGRAKPDQVELVGRAEHEGHPCTVIQQRGREVVHRWWLAEDQEYSPVVWEGLRKDGTTYVHASMQYEQDERGLWQLKAWRLQDSMVRTLERSLATDVTSVELNSPVDPDTFTFEFPPGTYVSDESLGIEYTVGARHETAGAGVRAEEPAGKWQATLPGGATVELVGVCEYPPEGRQWWRPDGTGLQETPYFSFVRFGAVTDADAEREAAYTRSFAVRLGGAGTRPDRAWTYRLAPARLSKGSPVLQTGGQYLRDLYGIAAAFPDDMQTCTLRFGVARDWETIAKCDTKAATRTRTPLGQVAISQAEEVAGGARVAVWHEIRDGQPVRLVALDAQGKVHTSPSGDLCAAPQTVIFDGLALDQIREFQLQTRPFEWVEFRNVSLEAGHKTEPEVVVEGAAATQLQVEGARGALDVGRRFLELLRSGKDDEELVGLTVPGTMRDPGAFLARMRQDFDLSKAEIPRCWIADEDACAVTSPFPTRAGDRTMACGLGLRRNGNRWLVRDLDALPTEQSREQFVKGFRDANPSAREFVVVQPAAAPASAGGLTFGPVVEQTVGDRQFVDLDSGRVLEKSQEDPAPGTVMAPATNDRAKKIGADLFFYLGGEGGQQPWCMANYGSSLRPLARTDDWPDLSADALAEMSRRPAPGIATLMALPDPPITFQVKTREGGIGILQIVGFTEDPKGTKIRYKMVQGLTAPAPQAAQRPRVLHAEHAAGLFVEAMARGDLDAAQQPFISQEEFLSTVRGEDAQKLYGQIRQAFLGSLDTTRESMSRATFLRLDRRFCRDGVLARAGESFGPVKLTRDTHLLDNVRAVVDAAGQELEIKLDAMVQVGDSWRLVNPIEVVGPARTTRAGGFGPVFERVLNDDNVGVHMLIDLDTGALYGPPADMGNSREEQEAWLRARGIDAIAEATIPGLGLLWTVSVPAGADGWEKFAAEVMGAVAGREPEPIDDEPVIVMAAKAGVPATFFFRTREGAIGVLQIVGFTEEPQSVKIRYKMVQGGAQPKAQTDEVPWGEAAHGMQVRLRPDKAAWQPGEVPTLKADVRNRAKAVLVVQNPDPLHRLEVDGVWFTYDMGLASLVVPLRVGPGGEQLGMPVVLTAGWQGAERRAPLVLTPGKHVVRFALAARTPGSDEEKPLSAISNAVEIAIAPVGAGTGKEAWGQVVNGLRVGVLADKESFGLDEPIIVHWRIENVGTENKTILWHPLHYSPVFFDVGKNGEQRRVREDARRSTIGRLPGPPQEVVLPPGGSIGMSFDLRYFGLQGRGSAGVYEIRGLYDPAKAREATPREYLDRLETAGIVTEQIASGTVQIELTEDLAWLRNQLTRGGFYERIRAAFRLAPLIGNEATLADLRKAYPPDDTRQVVFLADCMATLGDLSHVEEVLDMCEAGGYEPFWRDYPDTVIGFLLQWGGKRGVSLVQAYLREHPSPQPGSAEERAAREALRHIAYFGEPDITVTLLGYRKLPLREDMLPLLTMFLGDKSRLGSVGVGGKDHLYRTCDAAALAIQKVLGRDWGLRIELPLEARDSIILRMQADLSGNRRVPTDQATAGEAVEGVQVRLRAHKLTWLTSELPTFRADLRNAGQREFRLPEGQCFCQLEVDGQWYEWSPGLQFGRMYDLGIGRSMEDVLITLSPIWEKDKESGLRVRSWWFGSGGIVSKDRERLRVDPGPHTVRVAFGVALARAGGGNGFCVISNPLQIEVKRSSGAETDSWLMKPDLAQALVDLHQTQFVMGQTVARGDDAARLAKAVGAVLEQARKVGELAAGTRLEPAARRLTEAMVNLQRATGEGDEDARKAARNSAGQALWHMLCLATGEAERGDTTERLVATDVGVVSEDRAPWTARPPLVPETMTAADRGVYEALKDKVTLGFDKTPLPVVVEFLRQTTRVKYTLFEQDLPPDQAPVTLTTTTTVEDALNQVCEQTGMVWKVRGGQVKIGSRWTLATWYSRVYNVGDLLASTGSPLPPGVRGRAAVLEALEAQGGAPAAALSDRAAALVLLIKQACGAGSWETPDGAATPAEAGSLGGLVGRGFGGAPAMGALEAASAGAAGKSGPRGRVFVTEEDPGSLVVIQTAEVHKCIEALLRELRNVMPVQIDLEVQGLVLDPNQVPAMQTLLAGAPVAGTLWSGRERRSLANGSTARLERLRGVVVGPVVSADRRLVLLEVMSEPGLETLSEQRIEGDTAGRHAWRTLSLRDGESGLVLVEGDPARQLARTWMASPASEAAPVTDCVVVLVFTTRLVGLSPDARPVGPSVPMPPG